MPDLVFPVSIFPLTAPLSSASVDDLLWDESAPTESLEIINGYLDTDNLDTDARVGYEHTQRGSHVHMTGASGTANLDYRFQLFGNWETPVSFDVDLSSDPAQAIPGANQPVYCKWPAWAFVEWMAFWMVSPSGEADDVRSHIFLVVNGELVDPFVRTIGQTSLPADAENPLGYKKSRVYSGNATIQLDQGWNDVGLYLITDRRKSQTRLWATNCTVMQIKRSNGS